MQLKADRYKGREERKVVEKEDRKGRVCGSSYTLELKTQADPTQSCALAPLPAAESPPPPPFPSF